LHAAGLLRKSFRPAPQIVPLRYLMRHRADLVAQAAQQVHLMQKSLTEMNLKLQSVFSDLDGQSAQAIIDAILAGERDPARLAALRDRRCKAEVEDIHQALRGDYRAEYLFVLRQSQATWRHLQSAIGECDAEIAVLSARVSCAAPGPLPAAPARQRQLRKNHPQYALWQEAWRFYGVDLSAVDGVSAGLVSVLMSEVGTREQLLAAFPSSARFCSWLGLCPDNRICFAPPHGAHPCGAACGWLSRSARLRRQSPWQQNAQSPRATGQSAAAGSLWSGALAERNGPLQPAHERASGQSRRTDRRGAQTRPHPLRGD
jgi:transposase